MGPETVTIIVGRRAWTGFERVQVRAALTEAARSFSIEVAAEAGSATAWTFKAGTEVEILFNGQLVLRGFVDRYRPRIAGHDMAAITVSGRGRGQDAIDTSAEHPTGAFRGKNLLEMLKELDVKLRIGFATDQPSLPRVPHYHIVPGETVFRLGEKLARSQGLFLSGQADGSILITKAGSRRHVGGLIEGQNILTGEADHNWSNRHSRVVVRGQRPYGHGREALEIERVALDAEVGRHRPVIVIHDGDTDLGRADRRARFRRDREAGNSLRANIGVQGFRDDAGRIWTPGFIVFLQSRHLDIAQDMAIESVTFLQDRRRGSTAMLALTDPRALGGRAGKGGRAGAAWKSDAGALFDDRSLLFG